MEPIDIKLVAKEICELKIDSNQTIQQCLNSFYVIMRKFGIKQGTQKEMGVQGNNFEWTMCKTLLYDKIISHLEIEDFMGDYFPSDLIK